MCFTWICPKEHLELAQNVGAHMLPNSQQPITLILQTLHWLLISVSNLRR